jgi:hypothetical protein
MTTVTEILEDPTDEIYTLLAVAGTTVTANILLTDGTTTTASCTIVDAPTGTVSFTEPALYGEITGWKVEGADGTVYESLPEHYADEDDVKTLTNRVTTNPSSNPTYTAVLELGMSDSDDKIKSVLINNNVPIPDTDDDLTKIANLYSAAFIFNTYYSNNATISPTSQAFTKDADKRLQDYIDTYLDAHSDADESIPVITATHIDVN